ncbi:uncharacterized protein LOC111396511 [Olea europaea var. sylvestris]|uniref:uncharacterized protein LOC111396511 n=1 Tax=Olea europaea var. sylvestris TaxID=158386 RepID=UPI000C1D1D6F|nr:uncharacterized protein LOC111396511 [Olea europaea var. sylvestris]
MNHTGTPIAPRVPEADSALSSSPLVAITLPSPTYTSLPPAAPAFASTSSARVQERFPDLQRSSLDSLLGHRPEIFLDYLRASSPSREVTAALSPPLHDSANLLTKSWGEREQGFLNEMPIGEALVTTQLHSHRSILYMTTVADKVRFELDKLMEAKDQALNLYNNMEAERAQFAIKEKESEEKLNMMGFNLNSRLEMEEKWMGEIRALREEAGRRVESEKKMIEEERVRTEEAVVKVWEVNERAREVMRRAEEAESRAARVMKTWRSSSKLDALAQNAYVVALEEAVKHIRIERPGFGVGFLEETMEEHKEELQHLSEAAGVRISSDEDDVTLREGLPPPSSS